MLLIFLTGLTGCGGNGQGLEEAMGLESKVTVTGHAEDGSSAETEASRKIEVVERYATRSKYNDGKCVFAVVLKNNNEFAVTASVESTEVFDRVDGVRIMYSDDNVQLKKISMSAGQTGIVWFYTGYSSELPNRYNVEISIEEYRDITDAGITEEFRTDGDDIVMVLGNYGEYEVYPFFTFLFFDDKGKCTDLEYYHPLSVLEPGDAIVERYETDGGFSDVKVYVDYY